MQRWVKLPNGNVIDANRVMLITKPESYPKMDEDGNDGVEWAVTIGTGFSRDTQTMVTGTKEEIALVIKNLIGAGT